MNENVILDELAFHDAALDNISVEGTTVRFVLEDVGYPPLISDDDDDPQIGLTLWVHGVTTIVQDGARVHDLAMQGSFGIILRLRHNAKEVNILMMWRRGGSEVFSELTLSGEKLTMTCGPYTYQPRNKA